MKRVIDIHSHILPCVDDGCKSKTEALKMLKMYEDQNVEAVICTPHYGPCTLTGADVDSAYKWLCNKSDGVKLYLGNEIHVEYFDPKDIGSPTGPRTLAGSKHILVEFEEWAYSVTRHMMCDGFAELARYDGTVILAHAERYAFIQEHPDFCKKIAKIAQIQVNAYDIVQNKNALCRKTARYLLENQLASYIGSDAHGAVRRSPALSVGVQWIYDHCPKEYADAVVHDNAAKIIEERR